MPSRSQRSSRPSSGGSDASSRDGAAMTWIMDHLYAYPERYIEIPLRTTYILNSNPKLNVADFQMLMMEHIATLPSQPRSLPHTFLSGFVRKCFPKDVKSVDFDQALTALDYLKNLEDRRKREIGKVIREAGVDSRDIRIIDLKERMQKVDNLYSRALLGIRLWTLINEFENGAYNRSNCIAMLNTLYPVDEPAINTFLSPNILAQNRKYLWKCITNFEKNGTTILGTLKASQGGWPSVHEKIQGYLRLALDMINQCEEICRQFNSSASIVSRTSSFSSESDNDVISVSERGNTLEKIVWQLGNLKNFRSHKKYKHSNESVEEFGISLHRRNETALFYD